MEASLVKTSAYDVVLMPREHIFSYLLLRENGTLVYMAKSKNKLREICGEDSILCVHWFHN